MLYGVRDARLTPASCISKGSVVTWGSSARGGDSSDVQWLDLPNPSDSVHLIYGRLGGLSGVIKSETPLWAQP